MTARMGSDGGNLPSLDLHGVPPHRVDAKLEHFLHNARWEHQRQVQIVTGHGASSRSGEPVLRKRVEKWWEQNKARYGIVQKEVTSKGGALLVDLRPPS